MDKKALQLASRFALPPNSLGYCGKDSAPEKFKKCILDGKCEGVTEEIDKFIGLGPYLKTLSEIFKKEKYAYEVVEAYWMGNDELKKAKNKDYKLLLENFKQQGVPSWLIDELKGKKPKRFIPSHLFQVLFVGVGKMSGSVPYDMNTINNCMIRWGKVEKIMDNSLIVNLNSLEKNGNGFNVVIKKQEHDYISGFLPNLKKGDTVAVHWKQIIKKMTNDEIKKIEFWTNEVLLSLRD